MPQLTYTICLALFHSLWQAVMLALLYFVIKKTFLLNASPLVKRNFIFSLIILQVFISIITGIIIGSNTTVTAYQTFLQELPVTKSTLQLITPWLFSLYSIVVVYKLLKVLYNWYNFRNSIASGLMKPSVAMRLFTDYHAARLGIKRKVHVWVSSKITTPLTYGFLKPVILLPLALVNNVSMKQAETILLHELTHIRNNDYLINWTIIAAETIFFFNPFIINLCRQLKLEREKACDLNVISFKYPAAIYAETLLAAERLKHNIPVFQLAAVNKKQQLLKRIHFFANDNKLNKIKSRKPVFVATVFLFAITAFVYTTTRFAINVPHQNSVQNPASISGSNEFVSSFIAAGITEENINQFIKKTAALIEAKAPEIETKLAAMQPAINKLKEKAEELKDVVSENFAMPVSLDDNAISRQVIIKEEQSGSTNKQVKVYTITYKNGKWILQPEWKLTAKVATDSSAEITSNQQ